MSRRTKRPPSTGPKVSSGPDDVRHAPPRWPQPRPRRWQIALAALAMVAWLAFLAVLAVRYNA